MKAFAAYFMMYLILFLACAHESSGEQYLAASTEVTQGALRTTDRDGKILELPLKHTSVNAEISGFIGYVEVTQYYENPFDEPIEAIYVFPLPQNSAVNDMAMKIGKRTIRGIVKKREEARQIYEAAKAAGKTAGLLEQERPTIFSQSLANILPGDKIEIMIRYNQDLTYDNGQYEFVFPMVVGPRYIPGDSVGKSGPGWAPDTDRVPDASKITPPVLKPEQRSGHDIDLVVNLDAGVPIQTLVSPSHQIRIKKDGKSKAEIKIESNDTIPNKDFILRYHVLGVKPEIAILTHSGDLGKYFMMMIQPKAEFKMNEITPKEMIFVVDCSGSMKGDPIAKAREAMRRCIEGMNPDDTFQIIRFSMSAVGFSPKPVPNSPENVKRGLKFINEMHGQGGTEMLTGIKAALDTPADPQRMRIVFFMTDGYIGNETEILAAIEKRLGSTRLFSFGVGSSVNRYLLNRMAEIGRGTVQYVRPDEDTEKAVTKFYNRISKPYLTNIQINWKNLSVLDVYPQRIPDLFAAQPIIIHGRYQNSGKATILLKGEVAGKTYEMPISAHFPEKQLEHAALATLWARTRIKDLMAQMYRGEKQEIIEQVTDLAIQYKLMSKYTSFVAVEEQVRNEGGKLKKVLVPVEIPDGVSYEGIFGEAEAASYGMTGAKGAMKAYAAPSLGVMSAKKFRAPVSRLPMSTAGERADGADALDALSVPEAKLEEVPEPGPEKLRLTKFAVDFKIKLVIGELDSSQIQHIVNRTTKTIQKKYVQICRQTSLVSGDILIWFSIEADGRVSHIRVKSSTLNNSEIETFVQDQIKKCRFPATKDKGKAYVTISFDFSY